MQYIDHHAHMVSRTTDDYQQMALTGCVAVTEPAFWAGWDRSGADGFEDYFRQLTEFEPARAGQYRIQHYTWMAMNPKEADDRELSRAVLARIPKFLDRPTVIGIGEIGLNRITRNEITTYTEQVELALAHKQMILIHTPHLEDKLKGTRISIDVLNWAAHKLERLTNHQLRHGEAVAIGLALDTTYSYLSGFLAERDWRRVISLLSRLGLAVCAPELGHRAGDQPAILRGLDEFREHLGGRLTIMLLRAIGVPFDAHEIDKGVMLGSVEVLRSLEAARVAPPPEDGKAKSFLTGG